jgi:hypothetical protein
MKQYVLIYRGAVQPENGQQHMTDWMAWVKNLGEAMLNPGTPMHPSHTLSQDGNQATSTDNPICGFSVIQAPDMAAAISLISPCPHITIGGSIEVAEAMNLPMA